MDEQGELERILLGGTPVYTHADIVARSGLAEDFGLRVWTALGFPTPPDGTVAFTEGDLNALRDIGELLDSELVDEELVLQLARAVGQTMGRLSSWLTDAWANEHGGAGGLAPDGVEEVLGKFEGLLLQGWRRQLAAAGLRALAVAPDAAGTSTLAVGFADIVSFTRLSREMDGDTLASFVEGFEETATAICAELGCRVVKTLGDEVLFTAADPAAAAEFALRITERHEVGEGFPRVRVGIAYGPLIQRLGDVFGTPVNLSARLTAQAHPGTVLVDTGLADALPPAYETVALRPRPLQGLGRVRPWVLRRPHLTSSR